MLQADLSFSKPTMFPNEDHFIFSRLGHSQYFKPFKNTHIQHLSNTKAI